jgi:hypothetical protein
MTDRESIPNASTAHALSEADFLQQKISETTVAIRHTVDELKASVPGAVDVTAWTRRYPWAAVAAAAATGFVAAKIVSPGKQPVTNGAPYVLPTNVQPVAAPQPAPQSSIFAPFMSALAHAIAQGVLTSLVQSSTPPAPESTPDSETTFGDGAAGDFPS